MAINCRSPEMDFWSLGLAVMLQSIKCLKSREPNGSMKKAKVNFEKRIYKVQKIHGLPKNKVIPPIAQRKRIVSEEILISSQRATSRPIDEISYLDSRGIKGRISGVFEASEF